MKETNFKLMEQFMYMQWMMNRYFHQSLHRRGSIGTPVSGQGRVLRLLKMKPEMTQRELVEILGMRSQSLGELLGKLEKNGYITRAQSETDKRVVVIRLSEKGMNADDPKKDLEGSKDIFGCLSEEEQELFGSFLSRITEELEKEFDSDSSDGRGRNGRRTHAHNHRRQGPDSWNPFNGL